MSRLGNELSLQSRPPFRLSTHTSSLRQTSWCPGSSCLKIMPSFLWTSCLWSLISVRMWDTAFARKTPWVFLFITREAGYTASTSGPHSGTSILSLVHFLTVNFLTDTLVYNHELYRGIIHKGYIIQWLQSCWPAFVRFCQPAFVKR